MAAVAGVYHLGGMTLVSEIALPELPLAQRSPPELHPVNIRLGSVPNHLADAVEVDPDCFATASRYFLRIPGIARYLVSHGHEVVVDPEPAALALDVRAYLLGTIFAVLCQQRGLVPLHASAISHRGGVVAFIGRSGQGKSSLAAHLAQRGFAVISDDVCLINANNEPNRDPNHDPNQAIVIPTAPWLKLWRNSLENLGRATEGLERVFSEDDKYRLPLEGADAPQPIRTLIFLEGDATSSAATLQIEPVSPVEAVPLLMNLIHQAYLLEATGQVQQSFLRCSRVSSQARAFRLIRPWGLPHLESTVDALHKFLIES
jgi:hypothetical protein